MTRIVGPAARRSRCTAFLLAAAAAVAVTSPAPAAWAGQRQGAASQEALTTDTRCGTSFAQLTGESWQDALNRADATYDGLESVRIFYSGLPQAWPGKMDTAGRPITVSFKTSPSSIINNTNGTLDTLRQWFASAPIDQDVYWSYYHEPEDNIKNGEFTAQQYRDAWRLLAQAADEAGRPRLKATLILMEWTLQAASGRDWHDYYPGADVIDVMGWDAYSSTQPAPTKYRSPEEMFGNIAQISEQEGLPFAIAETGSGLITGDSGTGRALWLRAVSSYLSQHGALFAQYFDLDWRANGGPDYRLSDAASRQAWTDFCN